MVKQERIEIESYVFILLSYVNKIVKWMICIDGIGSCGSSESKEEAIIYILESSRLTQKQKNFIQKDRNKYNNCQLELF